jgi:hypothetical protein
MICREQQGTLKHDVAEAMEEALRKTHAEFEHLRGVLLTVIPSFFFRLFCSNLLFRHLV